MRDEHNRHRAPLFSFSRQRCAGCGASFFFLVFAVTVHRDTTANTIQNGCEPFKATFSEKTRNHGMAYQLQQKQSNTE
jgi:hypothetical protein